MLGQHDMAHDVAGRLPFHVGDLAEARNIGVHMLLSAGPDEMAIGAEALGERLAVLGVGLARDRRGERNP